MLKRLIVMAMLMAVFSVAVVPETFAHGRCRRGAYRAAYYGSPYRTAYYGNPYYRTGYYRTGYYGNPYYRTYSRSPYVYSGYSGVAGSRYYYGRRRGHSTRRALLTIGAPAAIGAGIGALLGGGKGAGVGALLGGGGGAAYYLVRRHRRY